MPESHRFNYRIKILNNTIMPMYSESTSYSLLFSKSPLLLLPINSSRKILEHSIKISLSYPQTSEENAHSLALSLANFQAN